MLGGLWRSLQQLVLPVHCASCRAPAPPERRMPLCEVCGRTMAELIQAPYCPLCGRRAGPYTVDEAGCMFCRLYPVRFGAAVRVGPYEGPLRDVILRAKHERRAGFLPYLGRLLAERLALAPWAARVDAVVPVPLHWGRRVHRGFDQAELLARQLTGDGRRLARWLRRVRPTPHQASLNASKRQTNVRGAFALRRRARGLKGRRALLVDDVMTSGTTIGECTRVLKRAGAAEVYVAVVATADYDEPGPW